MQNRGALPYGAAPGRMRRRRGGGVLFEVELQLVQRTEPLKRQHSSYIILLFLLPPPPLPHLPNNPLLKLPARLYFCWWWWWWCFFSFFLSFFPQSSALSCIATTMLGHYPSVEKTQLVSYVEEYLECVESLPLDLQRNVSLLREIDTKYQGRSRFRHFFFFWGGERAPPSACDLPRKGDPDFPLLPRLLSMRLQDDTVPTTSTSPRGDRGRALPQVETDFGESAILAADGANGVEEAGEEPAPREKKSKSSKKKKRSKAKQEREVSPVEFAIDPNEPTYCLCNQVSYGEMIGCDNEECPIEWFHFSCVGLTYKPKGKWYCPKCRGDSEKTMDKSIEKAKKDRRSR
nr:PREDICTED: inhibitor of growth protein 2 [Lepisosteus oculatus]